MPASKPASRHHAEVMRDDDQCDVQPPRQLLHQFKNLGLDCHIEGSGRLIGDDQPGTQASAIATMTRWRMPPEN